MKGVIWIMVCLLCCSVDAHFFNEKAQGWHWYQVETKPTKKDKPQQYEVATPKSAVEELAEKRKALEEAMAEAILRPNPRNVIKAQQMQHKLLNQSQKFSAVWMQNLLQNPELDATVKHPVTQFGIRLKKEDDQFKIEDRVKELSRHYGLFFIYQGNCRFCKGMAGVVKQLSDKYGWKVLGVSQDGVVLPEFPESKRDNGISQAWGIKGVPSVFVVNPETEQVIPIGHGLISLDQLEHNLILQLFKKG